MSGSFPKYDPDTLKGELTRDEGRRSRVYRDSRGIETVGIGHNLAIPQNNFTIDALYQNDVNGCEASLDEHWPWWRMLDPVRQRVMMGLMFNMGAAGLGTFTHTLAAIQDGQWQAASSGLLASTYAHQVGNRALRYAFMLRTGAVGTPDDGPEWA